MKRDWTLFRKILLAAASREGAFGSDSLLVEGFSDIEIAEHILLLHEGNLIEAGRASPQSDEYFIARVTDEGRNILKLMGNDDRWETLQAIANRFGVGLSGDTIVLIAYYLDSQPRAA